MFFFFFFFFNDTATTEIYTLSLHDALPIRSRVPLVTFSTGDPVFNVPEYTRKNTNWPANGSVIILNASAEKGSLSSGFRSTSLSVFGSMPLTGGISRGEGR